MDFIEQDHSSTASASLIEIDAQGYLCTAVFSQQPFVLAFRSLSERLFSVSPAVPILWRGMPTVIDWSTSLLSFCTVILPNGTFWVSNFGGFLRLIKHPVIALVLPYDFIFHYFSMSLFLCVSFSFLSLYLLQFQLLFQPLLFTCPTENRLTHQILMHCRLARQRTFNLDQAGTYDHIFCHIGVCL